MNTTGLQVAHVGLIALVEKWRDQLSPKEFAVMVDLVGRWLEVERTRQEKALQKWVA